MFQAIGNKSHPSQEIAPWLRYGCGLPRTRPMGVKLFFMLKIMEKFGGGCLSFGPLRLALDPGQLPQN